MGAQTHMVKNESQGSMGVQACACHILPKLYSHWAHKSHKICHFALFSPLFDGSTNFDHFYHKCDPKNQKPHLLHASQNVISVQKGCVEIGTKWNGFVFQHYHGSCAQ